MTIHVPQIARGRRSLPAFSDRETLEQLPSRRPPAPSPSPTDMHWEQLEPDTYVVRRGGRTLGFVDVVGAVFVVLSGPRYSRAVEFAQTLVFEEALAALTGQNPTCDASPVPIDTKLRAKSHGERGVAP